MSGKCVAMGCCFSFLVITGLILFLIFFLPSFWFFQDFNQPGSGNTLIVYDNYFDAYADTQTTVKCNVLPVPGYTMPSLHSFIRATTTGFILNGLAVYSKLSNACQPLEDVRNAQIQVHKVALVNLANNDYSLCPLEKLTVNAQNAGYSVLIYFVENSYVFPLTKEEISAYNCKLLIPILYATSEECGLVPKVSFSDCPYCDANSFLASNDRSNVEIRVRQHSFELKKMKSYLNKLYFWYLVGPIITLVWLTRTKKFCCMFGTRQVGEDRAVGSGIYSEMRNMEEAANSNEESFLNSVTEQTVENHHAKDDSEGQPLLIAANNAEYMRHTQGYISWHGRCSCRDVTSFRALFLHAFSQVSHCNCPLKGYLHCEFERENKCDSSLSEEIDDTDEQTSGLLRQVSIESNTPNPQRFRKNGAYSS
ncbi:uncharacterized protein [Montipora capricornis]|uniref:uncharacterized protein isoform X2 n=1 Tax=Montipora capricornis TaxID=246305 RepID=UPI0035F158BC